CRDTRHVPGARKARQVQRGFAKALFESADGSYAELPSNEGVEVDAPCHQVPARLLGRQPRAIDPGEPVEHLRLDERDVIPTQPIRVGREGAGPSRIAIAL